MTPTRIFSTALLILALVLGFFLVRSIKSKIELANNIEKNEKLVVQKLKWIRDAELAYLSANGEYTNNWDTLISFIKTGEIPDIVKKEHIKTLAYGADSTWFTYDTLGYNKVIETTFKPEKNPGFNPDELPNIPGSNKQFKLETAKRQSDNSNREVHYFMAQDTYVIDPSRKLESHPYGPLQVGSLVEATTQGNWE